MADEILVLSSHSEKVTLLFTMVLGVDKKQINGADFVPKASSELPEIGQLALSAGVKAQIDTGDVLWNTKSFRPSPGMTNIQQRDKAQALYTEWAVATRAEYVEKMAFAGDFFDGSET